MSSVTRHSLGLQFKNHFFLIDSRTTRKSISHSSPFPSIEGSLSRRARSDCRRLGNLNTLCLFSGLDSVSENGVEVYLKMGSLNHCTAGQGWVQNRILRFGPMTRTTSTGSTLVKRLAELPKLRRSAPPSACLRFCSQTFDCLLKKPLEASGE